MTLALAILTALLLIAVACAVVAVYIGTVTGAVTIDIGIGRRLRPLTAPAVDIAADPAIVYQLLTQPYLGRTTRALAEKVQVLQRGTDMVLAAHRTPVRGRLTAVTVETVRFTDGRRIDFHLLRGPVPHVVEHFALTAHGHGTRLEYHGELGTDLAAAGAWWGNIVARQWEAAVAATMQSVKAEAERQATRRR